MAKLARVTQKIFGSTAGSQQIAQFGSLAEATPNYTTDPAVIQALNTYLGGWFPAVLGNNSPAIEDMNALFYLLTYQMAYAFQAGVPEYSAGTNYYQGSICSSAGVLYTSLIDNNLGNALTDATKWNAYSSDPSGTIKMYGGANAPSGYLLCDGASYLRTSYPNLFTVIGTTYGSVDGTHFNVPNYAGNVAVGPGGSIGAVLGGTGGESAHTLTIQEMPSHTHQENAYNAVNAQVGNSANFYGLSNGPAVGNGPMNQTTVAMGGGGPHNNVQPFLVSNFIIKT